MQNAGIINLIAKVAAYYEINMKRRGNVKICKCVFDVQMREYADMQML